METESGGDKIEYFYDRFSNRYEMIVTGNQGKKVTTKYVYNRNNWLKKEEKSDGKITDTFYYRYDANGNQCSRQWERVAPKGTASVKRLGFTSSTFREDVVALDLREYNGFNQLISVNRDNVRTLYTYRPDSLRHSKTVDGVTATHYWDGQNLIAEYGVNDFKARYLRGINLIAQQIGTENFYYLHNAHGDVVQRVGADGNAAPVYEYDAFGNQKNFIATDPNPFRYCGELYDSETESYYLRARSMEPRTGRFTAEDSVRGATYNLPNEQEMIDPLSLNLYTYANGNPILYTDPSGHFSLGKILSGSMMMYLGYAAMAAGLAALTVATGGLALLAITGTIVVGGGSIVYGAYEVAEGLTGQNALRGAMGDQAYADTGMLLSMGTAAGAQFSAEYAYMNTYVPQGLAKEGLGDFSGNSYPVSRGGIDAIRNHFNANDYNTSYNDAMLNRLETSLSNGGQITGADASFYFHELKEASLMQSGISSAIAHQTALDYYGVSPYSVYHPNVIQANPQWFGSHWFDFWNL